MKRAFAVVALASLASLATVGAADSDPTAEATAASRAWLSVVDAGQYGRSWDKAAALFKQHISKSQWERAVGDVRKQTGARRLANSNPRSPHINCPAFPMATSSSSSIALRLQRPRPRPKRLRQCAMRMATGASLATASSETAPEGGGVAEERHARPGRDNRMSRR